MTQEKVIDLIRKCLALTTSPNPGEAANATAKVQELLFKHKLTMADIDIKEEGPVQDDALDLNPQRHEGKWRAQLSYTLAKYNFCSMILAWHGKTAYIVGTKDDIEVVQEIYHWVVEQPIEEEKTAWKTLPHFDRRKTFRRSFFTAAVNSITGRLYEQWQSLRSESQASTALVVSNEEALKSFIDEHYGELRKGRRAGSYGSVSGYYAGREAGSRVSLSRRTQRIAQGGLIE